MSRNKKDCPCRDCVAPERHEACHDSCQKYKEWVQPFIEVRKQRVIYNLVREAQKSKVVQIIDRRAMERKRGRK